MASHPTAAAHRRLTAGPVPSPHGSAGDVHPVVRRATAPPAALDLLAQARSCLADAASLETPNERYAIAHLAALRTAAAVLAARGDSGGPPAARPDGGVPVRRGRRAGIRSAWELLSESAPELSEWSAHFAAGAPRRARAEAGIRGAADGRAADELLRDAGMFLRLVERMLQLRPPPLPEPRTDPSQERQERPQGRPPECPQEPQEQRRPEEPTGRRER